MLLDMTPEEIADELISIVQNDYMIDGKMTPTGEFLNAVADWIMEITDETLFDFYRRISNPT